MHVEQKNEGGTPFQEKCNTEHFFVGGGRGAILSDIKTALQEKVDLVTLIGEEGSGKTMLCKMLQEQWHTQHKILFLPQIVESFEDVVRITAQECGVPYPVDTNRADAKKIFLNIIATLRARGETLLLICDEAEKMYLATLERIRKVVDDVKAEGGGLQLLLAGRKSLGGNLEQLALCDFDKISEKQFFLSALDDNETWGYLNFCVQEFRGDNRQEVFTKEAAAKIASMGRGNLRLINVYADESLQSSNADTSFLVLLDHVNDDGSDADLLEKPSHLWTKFSFSPQYLVGAGLVCFVLVMIFVFSGDDKKELPEFPAEQVPSSIVTVSPEKVQVVEQEAVPPPPVQEVEVEVAVKDVISPVVEPEVIKVPMSESSNDMVEKKTDTEGQQGEPQVVAQYTPVEISPVEIVERTGAQLEVPEHAEQSKILADKSKRLVSTRIVSSQTKKTPGKAENAPKTTAVVAATTNDPILGRFFIAGEKWQTGEMDSSFSIQLMALKSDQAEENLKRIVSQPDYQAVADKLVMLKRPSYPPVVLVFYGVYPTMAAARSARNNMPIFLRERHPYPVSVRGAVEKARVE